MGPRCTFCDAAKRLLARNNITKKTFKLDMTETSDYADESWEDI